MGYVFKERIKYSEYIKFIKDYSFLSFMQEDNWVKTKNNANHLIVAVLNNNKVCAVAQIIINKRKCGNQFYIPNGYLLDFNNKTLLEFLTFNIKNLAKKYNAYVIDLYPNISTHNPNFNSINHNLLELGYNFKDEYLDNTNNILIPLKRKNKKISKSELKRKYENKDFYLKRGIFFETSTNPNDIDRIDYLINDPKFDKELIQNLFKNFDKRVRIVFAKLDLVFYANYLKEYTDNSLELMKINELLEISDELDIGCALIIEPYNEKDTICEFIYNTEKESFENLDIMNGLLYETMKICNEKGYSYIKVSNINLDVKPYIERYQGTSIKYIGHYNIILNKFKHYINKKYR